MPLDKSDDVVKFKLSVLDRALPARSSIVFGDVFRIDGGYTIELAERGVGDILLLDSLETPALQRARIDHPAVDFRKGDFSDPLFMGSVRDSYELGILFDIMLHQPGLLGTLTEMLAKVEERLCIVQPMLAEQALPNSIVYLPGNSNERLYPQAELVRDHQVFEVESVNHANWIWGMTPSFFTAAMRGEGFESVFEKTLAPLPNPIWSWWGAVYERRRQRPNDHWSGHLSYPGLFEGDW